MRRLATDDVDVVIVEVGGTVGDIEIVPSSRPSGSSAATSAGTTSATSTSPSCPTSAPSGEQKTKPTQHSVTELRSRGIQPDVIVCRKRPADRRGPQAKISLLCDVPIEAVVSAVDAASIYEIPLLLHEEGLDGASADPRHRRGRPPDRPVGVGASWRSGRRGRGPVRIGIIGKYVKLPDAYLSVVEALRHAGFHHGAGSRSNGSRPRR